MRNLVDTPVSIQQSLMTYYLGGEYAQVRGHHMLKHPTDLARYERIIKLTEPEVVVETGTRTGASALWFSERVPMVITIDINPRNRIPSLSKLSSGKVLPIVGDAADPEVVERVQDAVKGRSVLLSLDSSHTHEHVRKEMQAFSDLVPLGGYMVVEDGLFDYASLSEWRQFSFGNPALGNPMDAIKECLFNNEYWQRDLDIEGMFPVSHHPVGWWRRSK